MKYLISIFLFISTYPCLAGLPKFEIDFGIVGQDKRNELLVIEKTNRIPLRLKNTGFRFGFIFKSNVVYEAQLKVRFSSSPKNLSGNTDIAVIKNNTLTYPVVTRSGMWSHISWFDDGDPTGMWEYQIYVNKKLYRTIQFEVYEE